MMIINIIEKIYLKETLSYVEIKENDMHDHGSSACGKRTFFYFKSLSSILTINTTL